MNTVVRMVIFLILAPFEYLHLTDAARLVSLRFEQLHRLLLERLDILRKESRDRRLEDLLRRQGRDRRFKMLRRRQRRQHVASQLAARLNIDAHPDCFDMAMPKAKAQLRDPVQAQKAHSAISDHDSCGAEHGTKAQEAKTSAAWVVATAAPHHATGNRDLLSGFITEHDGQFVHAANRVPMKALARGAVVTDTMVLPDVWFVPGLTGNLVSVSQLAELNYSIGFGCGQCCIKSPADSKIMGKAHLQEGGLYKLDFLKVPLAI